MDHSASYPTLVTKGLLLNEQDFTLVIESITKGAKEAMEYLGVNDAAWPKIEISDTVSVLGYSVAQDSICFSVRHLNHISQNTTPLIYKDQLVCFIPDTFYIIIKYLTWLKLFGRESTIHRYQKLGNPKLHASFPAEFPAHLSSKQLLLSNIEIEARNIGDEISEIHKDFPLWGNLNKYLGEQFPQYYDKTVDEIVSMPKPPLSISFEMESFGI